MSLQRIGYKKTLSLGFSLSHYLHHGAVAALQRDPHGKERMPAHNHVSEFGSRFFSVSLGRTEAQAATLIKVKESDPKPPG